MESRCSALFNGAVSSHWSITSHKSITCHLCNSSITPYAAYHPDCLRKHFVRRHEVRRCMRMHVCMCRYMCMCACACTCVWVCMHAQRERESRLPMLCYQAHRDQSAPDLSAYLPRLLAACCLCAPLL
jgi:hypothetical protein